MQGSISREAVLARLRAGEAIVHIARDAGVPISRFHTGGSPILYPGVKEGLAELQRRGTRMGVVTSLSPHLVVPALHALGIESFFGEAVVHPGNSRSRKPNPDGLLNALGRLSIAPSKDVFYVGDREIDAQAASNAGISFAWAAYGYGDSEPASSTAILDGFAAVLRL